MFRNSSKVIHQVKNYLRDSLCLSARVRKEGTTSVKSSQSLWWSSLERDSVMMLRRKSTAIDKETPCAEGGGNSLVSIMNACDGTTENVENAASRWHVKEQTREKQATWEDASVDTKEKWHQSIKNFWCCHINKTLCFCIAVPNVYLMLTQCVAVVWLVLF